MTDDQSIYNNNAIIFNWHSFNDSKPNDSWDGIKDPCTTELGVGWRVPTRAEWDSVLNPALNPPGKIKVLSLQLEMTILIIPPAKCLAKRSVLPAAGIRDIHGALSDRNNYLYYWSRTVLEGTGGSYTALSVKARPYQRVPDGVPAGCLFACIRD